MKEIKSVRLKREYRDTTYILFANQYATKIPDCKGGAFWEFKTSKGSQYSFSEQTIRNNYTDLFEIEYEEGIKFVDIRFEFPAVYEFITTEGLKNATIKDYCLPGLKVTKLGEGTL